MKRPKLKPGKIWALRFGVDDSIADLLVNKEGQFWRRTYRTKREALEYVRRYGFTGYELIRLEVSEI